MEVILAKHYGFCPGVKRVVHILKTLLEKHDKVFTYGQLIHNNQFIDKMKSNGMVIASSLEDIPRKSCVLTRAHGIIKSDKEILEHMDVDYVDGTCPFVDAVHIKANQLAQEGYQVILVGDKNHPEVVSALSYMDNPIIIEGPDELNNIELTNKVGVVSQTTQAKQNIDDVKRRLEELGVEDIKVINTRCGATEDRQSAVKALARDDNIDVIIVIGGRHSANTKRLKQIASEIKSTYHIETKDDINPEWFIDSNGNKIKKVGVTAGASTPDWVIEDVVNYLKSI
ncbi:4-hydroxy-3-methylbut-2-enyl diphosphate reductase [Candidatus Micrarchaeota archaeon]|nr:4-hydroxy-3-methylbut-2-enyl diphosphate reductase [Candidatus Micrarchaeota archaeon]